MLLLERVTGWIVATIFGVFVALTFLQVVLRYAFSNSLGWIDELCRYGFIWMVALAAAIAARQGTHMCITLLEEIAGQQFKRPFQILGDIGLIAFAALLGMGGWQLMQLNWTSLSPAMQLPIAYVEAILPIFGLLTALFAGEHAVRLLLNREIDAMQSEDT
ncbi:TRAP transporter small permease [Oceanicola sp. 502str15]|uniref:TRAP transporter small permease n=1 Tax=Oceanicola sp. 502str15 TaxID=2696061 RepID=UPI002094AE22|nr:TRAP transporter small permease [Oceanicola sp. 502str15]MCO6383269.1 TRAP transporter small permease subunit [Oceanicola sp. 502str15]